MAEGLAEEGAFSANLTHFWHFITLMKRLFIPYSEEKSKRFVAMEITCEHVSPQSIPLGRQEYWQNNHPT
jgi:hypothetical protein